MHNTARVHFLIASAELLQKPCSLSTRENLLQLFTTIIVCFGAAITVVNIILVPGQDVLKCALLTAVHEYIVVVARKVHLIKVNNVGTENRLEARELFIHSTNYVI